MWKEEIELNFDPAELKLLLYINTKYYTYHGKTFKCTNIQIVNLYVVLSFHWVAL